MVVESWVASTWARAFDCGEMRTANVRRAARDRHVSCYPSLLSLLEYLYDIRVFRMYTSESGHILRCFCFWDDTIILWCGHYWTGRNLSFLVMKGPIMEAILYNNVHKYREPYCVSRASRRCNTLGKCVNKSQTNDQDSNDAGHADCCMPVCYQLR